jgi:hypothetical protein
MGIEYKLAADHVDEQSFVQHIESLPYGRRLDIERNSYGLFGERDDTPFAYLMFYEGALYFTDVQTEPAAAAEVFRGLIDLCILLGKRVTVEDA